MTENTERETVKDIDHTHPHTDETFGESGVYERGSEGEDEEERPDEVAGGTDEPANRTAKRNHESDDRDRETRPDGGRPTDRTDRSNRKRDRTQPGRPVQETFDRGGEARTGR
jgi:hypothetical protein